MIIFSDAHGMRFLDFSKSVTCDLTSLSEEDLVVWMAEKMTTNPNLAKTFGFHIPKVQDEYLSETLALLSKVRPVNGRETLYAPSLGEAVVLCFPNMVRDTFATFAWVEVTSGVRRRKHNALARRLAKPTSISA